MEVCGSVSAFTMKPGTGKKKRTGKAEKRWNLDPNNNEQNMNGRMKGIGVYMVDEEGRSETINTAGSRQ